MIFVKGSIGEVNHYRLFKGFSMPLSHCNGSVIGRQNGIQKQNMKYMSFAGRSLGIRNLNLNLIIRFFALRSMVLT
jgi:hypothetical protein